MIAEKEERFGREIDVGVGEGKAGERMEELHLLFTFDLDEIGRPLDFDVVCAASLEMCSVPNQYMNKDTQWLSLLEELASNLSSIEWQPVPASR